MLSRVDAAHILPSGLIERMHERAGMNAMLAWLRQGVADRVPRAGQHAQREHVLTRLA